MTHWDRIDICEAHYCMEMDYNRAGWIRERPSNQLRLEASAVQLHRLGFRATFPLGYETLTENGRGIYDELEQRYGLVHVEPGRYCVHAFRFDRIWRDPGCFLQAVDAHINRVHQRTRGDRHHSRDFTVGM